MLTDDEPKKDECDEPDPYDQVKEQRFIDEQERHDREEWEWQRKNEYHRKHN